MSALPGTFSYVIISSVEAYRTCSIDLRWQRSIHSCQRCPRAVLMTNAVAIPQLRQSQVERTHSRFCPSGVHMSSCIPATECRSNLVSGTVGAAHGELITAGGTTGIAPPNLPAPAASPHDPVRAGNLTRLSYPPASSSSVSDNLPDTQNSNSDTKTIVHRIITGDPAKADVRIASPTPNDNKTNSDPASSTISLRQTGPPKVERIVSPVVTIIREQPKKDPTTVPSQHKIITSDTVSNENGDVRSIVLPAPTSRIPPVVSIKKEESDYQNADTSVIKQTKKDEPTPGHIKANTSSDTSSIHLEPVPKRVPSKPISSETETDKHATPTHDHRPTSKQLSTNGSTPLSNNTALNRQQPIATPPTVREIEPIQPKPTHPSTGGLGDIGPLPVKPNGVRIDPTHPPSGPVSPLKNKQHILPPKKPVPAFYFPHGTSRMTKEEVRFEITRAKRELVRALESLPDMRKVSMDTLIPFSHFAKVAKVLNCPLYWKYVIYSASGGTAEHQSIALSTVLDVWEKVLTTCPDETARFVYFLTSGKSSYLVATDFKPLIQDILETHPGLAFLRSAKDFHSRYVGTVVARIFFNVNASWTGQITLAELRKNNFLSVLASLEDQEDINLVTQYFSYEHFYVIYCKFWELDDDHDLIISRADLARHNNYAISERMIDRIFSGTVTRGASLKEGVMSYADFVWFLLAEEDKRHPRSVEYWFRCMDLDGDGVLSIYELEYFYSEQVARLEEMGIEPIAFADCLCQCLDMVKPKYEHKILLSDLKNCRLSHIFFDTFFNLPKYLQHEQRDPFSNLRDIEEGLTELSDWDRYASETYEMLVAIEGDNQADAMEDEEEEVSDEDNVINAAEGNQRDSSQPTVNSIQQKEPISIVKQQDAENVVESTDVASSDMERKDKRKRGAMVNGSVSK